MFADAEMQVASAVVFRAEVTGAVEGESRLRRGREIGRSADQPRHILCDCIQNLGGRVAARYSLGIGGKNGNVFIPSIGKLTALHLVEIIGELRIFLPVLLELLTPCKARFAPTFPDSGLEVVHHTVGHQKLRVFWPSVISLRQLDFAFAERLTVGAAGILLVGSSVADVAVDNDQRWAVVALVECAEGAPEHLEVVGIAHPSDVPSVGHEASRDVVAESERGVAFNADVIVVVNPAEVRELQMSGE